MFALIQSGNVIEVAAAEFMVAAPLAWVDCTATPGVAAGWTYAGGVFTAPPASPPPTLAQQANAQLASGVAVTFSTSATLSATYRTDLMGMMKVLSEAACLVKTQGASFTNNTATLTLVDAGGTARNMSVTVFNAFEAAYQAYITQMLLVQDTNAGALPPATLTVNA